MFIFFTGRYPRAPKKQKKGETQIPPAFMDTLYIWLIAETIQKVWIINSPGSNIPLFGNMEFGQLEYCFPCP